MVIVQQAGPETGVGHNHLVHRMHHAVFHGVVLQFVDDGGTPVDDAECHSVGIDRVSVGHDDYGQVKLVAFLMCFGQVVCVQCPFHQAGFDERVAKRCRNVLDGGVSPFFQEIFHAGVHGREQRPRSPACQQVHSSCPLHYTLELAEIFMVVQEVAHHFSRECVIAVGGKVVVTTRK